VIELFAILLLVVWLVAVVIAWTVKGLIHILLLVSRDFPLSSHPRTACFARLAA
jgi:hypothetical protein